MKQIENKLNYKAAGEGQECWAGVEKETSGQRKAFGMKKRRKGEGEGETRDR